MNGLFIFHRDLRLEDNVGLLELSLKCKNIFTVFIFTKEQITDNKYINYNSISFMLKSLSDLEQSIHNNGGKLYFFLDNTEKCVKKLCKVLSIDVVGYNKDITPYSIKRDDKIKKVCEELEIECIESYDYFLNQPNLIVKQDGTPYKKFTPYYLFSKTKVIKKPLIKKFSLKRNSIIKHNISLNEIYEQLELLEDLDGGRDQALKVLKQSKKLKSYSKTRNILSKPTSQLSAYIKFGCISIREVYYAMKDNTEFIKQLYWRDFYASIMYYFPHVIKGSMMPKYDNLEWSNDNKLFKAWKTGMTGFPIVDAGMRELIETGHMHNRARLICSSFLVKTLFISWQKGEKFFAQTLTDYDPASNNGNWQWIAGTGTDSQPYFRIFNPWRQGKEYDPDCKYILKWVPELNTIPINHIHKWNEKYDLYKGMYLKPIVNFDFQKKIVLKKYHTVK